MANQVKFSCVLIVVVLCTISYNEVSGKPNPLEDQPSSSRVKRQWGYNTGNYVPVGPVDYNFSGIRGGNPNRGQGSPCQFRCNQGMCVALCQQSNEESNSGRNSHSSSSSYSSSSISRYTGCTFNAQCANAFSNNNNYNNIF